MQFPADVVRKRDKKQTINCAIFEMKSRSTGRDKAKQDPITRPERRRSDTIINFLGLCDRKYVTFRVANREMEEAAAVGMWGWRKVAANLIDYFK